MDDDELEPEVHLDQIADANLIGVVDDVFVIVECIAARIVDARRNEFSARNHAAVFPK